MSISSLVSRVIPTAVGFVTGGPVGAATAFASVEAAKSQERKIKQQQQAQINQMRSLNMDPFLQSYNPSSPSIQSPMVRPTTANAGFGAGFGNFLTDVGRNIVSPFANLATAVSPFFNNRSVAQQPAVTSTRSSGAQETQGSGSIEAGMGGLAGSLIQQAGRFLRTTPGQIGTGLAIGGATSMFSGGQSGMRMTRKMKSQARTVLNMVGGDINAAANILGISEEMLVALLLKRFRNDGPVVTKAALRKTKQTVRRLKSMCDMYDSLRPTATRRRAPMKRASSTTLIKN
tara:strand:+ start:819 stop:1682 length:864 start_codon:yes stop_codon:yes gene_type:complete